jgi:uncharacterized protein YndB with AHSA1/START domain/ketosteroid isomerase-like protein
METTKINEDIINRFFDAYNHQDKEGIRNVMDEQVVWYFPGQHPFAGVKIGLDEVLAFFDAVGTIMKQSNPKIEKLITAENGQHFIECQKTKTNRSDGLSLDHESCVLWTIRNGKIVEGRHFFSDPKAVDNYFNAFAPKNGMNNANENGPVIKELTLQAPVEKVWKAIVRKKKMKDWFFDIRKFKPEEGLRFKIVERINGRKYPVSCEVKEVQKDKKLSYSWRYDDYPGETRVSFILTPEGERTRLKFTHSGLEKISGAGNGISVKKQAEKWNKVLGSTLKKQVEKKKDVKRKKTTKTNESKK